MPSQIEIDAEFAMPSSIRDVDHLEDLLSEPSAGVIDMMRRVSGDFILLGVGGKMGPSLARMLRRAADAAGGSPRRVMGVSRFSSSALPDQLRQWNIEPIPCDLLNNGALDQLPDAPNVVYMAGMKFGSAGNPSLTWAMNALLPGVVAKRYRSSRMVAFSTGNVYPLVPVASGGSVETDALGPVGEYAASCLGRERLLEHASRTYGTPMSIIRLNYAVEMRYGVLADLAAKVWSNRPIDLSTGHFNCIWQADANAQALLSLEHAASPPTVLNVTGPEILSVRRVCEHLGRLLDREPTFEGTEAPTALLNNSQLAIDWFGYPRVGPMKLIEWTADWTRRGGETLAKPTHFETRDGKF